MSLLGIRPGWSLPHEDQHTHRSLTDGAFTLLDSAFYSQAHREIVARASVDEDQCPNYLSHFYNPKTGADGGIYSEPFCDLFPVVLTAPARAAIFYDDAVLKYRLGDTEGAFRSLGAVMHLLQDMTSPAHVHIDAHAQASSDCGNDGDDFEKWGWCAEKTVAHIRDYVTAGGAITERLQNSLDRLFSGVPQFPPDLGRGGSPAIDFVHHVADEVYDFTTIQVVLEDPTFFDDPQPNSEMKRMFPSLREGSPGYYIDGVVDRTIGYTTGNCGGGCGSGEEWWLIDNLERSCVDNGNCVFVPTAAIGYAYIENTGGEDGFSGGFELEDLLVPRVYEKQTFLDLYGTTQNAGIASGFGDPRPSKTLLRVYGDVLYATAVAYGAGLLQAFHDEVAPAPVAVAGGPYGGEGCAAITFDASGSSDADGSIVEYAWDFDADGAVDLTSDQPIVEHTYPAAYQGLAQLTVTDEEGQLGQDSAEVDVTECAQLPGGGGGGGCASTSYENGSGADPRAMLPLAFVFGVLLLRRLASRARSDRIERGLAC